MSNDKVVLGDRLTKKVILPKCKAEVEIYASIIAQDMGAFDLKKLQDKNSNNISDAIDFLTKLIKSWNIYGNKDDEKPREITIETVGLLPVEDLTFLFNELQTFVTSEKKD